jgi:hypothetical protein
MPLFVSFEDDNIDPTYADASDAVIVSSLHDAALETNPCVGRGVRHRAPVAPRTEKEIIAFAKVMGWRTEGSGSDLVIYPAVSEDD